MIAIRPARPEDAATVAMIYRRHVLHGIASFEVDAPDAAAMRARIMAGDGLYPWLVATKTDAGAVLGYAHASRFRERAAYAHSVETSIYLADAAQGRGAGRLLYGALVATLRAQGFVQAIGSISLPNPASIALHEAVGFRRAGVYREIGWKDGRWVDVGLWQRALAEAGAAPGTVRAFAEVGVVRG